MFPNKTGENIGCYQLNPKDEQKKLKGKRITFNIYIGLFFFFNNKTDSTVTHIYNNNLVKIPRLI